MNSLLLTLMVLTDNAADRLKKRREAGQGSLEYVGMIAIAALIVAAMVVIVGKFGPGLGSVVDAAIAKVQGILGG